MPNGKNRTGRFPDVDVHDDDELDLCEDDFESDEFDVKALVKQHVDEANKFIRTQQEKLEKRVDDHEHRLTNMEKQISNLAAATSTSPAVSAVSQEPTKEKTSVDRFLDMTLGTAGRALHAVVDTLAFVGESTVDIVTLGRGRPSK